MTMQVQTAAIADSGAMSFGLDSAPRLRFAIPALPSGWWFAPFLITGTLFWAWAISSLLQAVI